MENLDFSEEEIEQQLATLGYTDVPKHRLRQFKRDLDELIRQEKLESQASSSKLSSHVPTDTEVKDCNSTSTSEFYSTSGPIVYKRQVFVPNQERENKNPKSTTCYDSYTHHTVSSKYPHNFTSPKRLEREVDKTTTRSLSSSPDRDEGSHGRPVLKRKVLRKLKGQFHVCDESAHSEDLVCEVSGLDEQLQELSMSVHQNSIQGREKASCRSDRPSTTSQGFSMKSYMRGKARSHSETDLKPITAVIRPMKHPHTNFIKCDPLYNYLQYKQSWETFKPPGEKYRRELKMEIREQLAYHRPCPKFKRLLPNTYVVPTDKKRSVLRWTIRNCLAHGVLPPS